VNLDIEIVDVASKDDVEALHEALYEFNREVTGYRDGRSLSCFIHDDDGHLVAGLDGFTWGGYAKIDVLWIHETLRGHGLGQRLIEAAEAEATKRGCRVITLDTHEFQAPGLYAKLGYEVRGETDDTPVGYKQFFYQKRLGQPA
jgi:ribosomal protein S18 acetylase RimI-like enzyme